MAKFLAAVACGLVCVGLARADSEASGSVSWQDKTVTYKVTGSDSVSGTASSNDKQCTVEIDLDGKKHTLVVNQAGLVYQGTAIPLTGFKKVEIVGTADLVRINVDGKQVHPKCK